MNTVQRRNKITEILEEEPIAISGSQLASMLGVSRQVIVQDIAVLRAAGVDIIATPQGYMLNRLEKGGFRKTIVSKHEKEHIRDELITIVDEGGTVIDVIVEHSIYGQICGNIMVSSRRDVDDFIDKICKEDVKPLCDLTGGIHLHTIECKNEEVMARIEEKLFQKGYLIR
ncbi:MAG: transcription repressor NadR [Clostridiaceae bacterium]|nr:transcription repressor NadR [Clostridiaceae bacterium]